MSEEMSYFTLSFIMNMVGTWVLGASVTISKLQAVERTYSRHTVDIV